MYIINKSNNYYNNRFILSYKIYDIRFLIKQIKFIT